MAYTASKQIKDSDEQIGAFSGYIRRPVPSISGMTALFFGEDGDDADTILALSLTKYQDVEVFVNVYLVKDSFGKVMKSGESYPLISSFIGRVRRSMPKRGGICAQFFAPNGVDSDSISILSKSEYQDCLVFVDVRGKQAVNDKDKISLENRNEIEINYSTKITKNERLEFLQKDKEFKKMNEILKLSGFLYNSEVHSKIGTPEDFKNWLTTTQTCSYNTNGSACLNNSSTIEVKLLSGPFNFLPVCDTHIDELRNEEYMKENIYYYEMKHRVLLNNWVWSIFKENFSYDGKSEPDPTKIIEWTASKNLTKLLPNKYNIVN